jgi:hypothetical protein
MVHLKAVRAGFCKGGGGYQKNREHTEGWKRKEPGHERLLAMLADSICLLVVGR